MAHAPKKFWRSSREWTSRASRPASVSVSSASGTAGRSSPPNATVAPMATWLWSGRGSLSMARFRDRAFAGSRGVACALAEGVAETLRDFGCQRHRGRGGAARLPFDVRLPHFGGQAFPQGRRNYDTPRNPRGSNRAREGAACRRQKARPCRRRMRIRVSG